MTDQQKPEISFHCTKQSQGCGKRFKTNQYRTEENPQQDWHPWDHFATCPGCGKEAGIAAHQLAAWRSIQAGKTLEGRAAISAANKARDPASYAVSRFNAITHGANAEVAKYYPARPGHYDICQHCEYLNEGCGVELRHCAKRTELFVQFHLAQETGDAGLLGKLMASTQAGLNAIIADMIRAVATRGVEIESPVWTKGENGIELAEWEDEDGKMRRLTKIEAHPLLLPLIAFVQKNNMTLGDMGLRPVDKEDAAQLKGFLDAKESDRETLADATRTQQALVANLLRVVGGGDRPALNGDVIDVELHDAG